MKNMNRSGNTNMNRYIKQTLLSVFIGECVAVVCILFFSIVISNIDVPSYVSSLFVIFSTGMAGLVGGYINGRMIKQKGIVVGAVVGVMLAIILILIKLLFFYPMTMTIMIFKLIAMIVAAIVGGILGANRKTKRIKY